MLAPEPTMRRRNFYWIVGIAIVLRLPVFFFPYVNIDENEYAIAGQVLLHGGLPYRDFLIYQPPVIYYLYAAAFALFRTTAMWAPHLIVIGIVVATCALLAAIGRRIFGDAAGWWAALMYAIFSTTFFPSEMLGANCEVVLLLPLCGAVWCLLRSDRATVGTRIAWQLAAGGLMGLAFLTKYHAGIFLVPFAAWACLTRHEEKGAWWTTPTTLLLSWGLVVGGALAWLAVAGIWTESIEAARYILWYAKGPPQADWAYIGLKGFVRTLMIAALAAFLWWHALRAVRHAHRYRWLCICWFLAGAATLCVGGRIYFHYYYLLLPPLALLAGAAVGGMFDRGWAGWSRPRRVAWTAWTIICALGFFGFACYRAATYGNLTSTDWLPAALRLRELAPPGSTLFVWGYCPQLYTFTGLRPATRFTTADYLTGRTPKTAGLEYDPTAGVVPSAWEKVWTDFYEPDPRRVVMEDTTSNIFPRAWEYLAVDFAKRLPDLIVDTTGANYRRYGRYPIQNFPLLHSVVTKVYTRVALIDGYAIYLRRTD